MPILTQRALLLARIETVSGTENVPVASTDSILVFDPIYSVDVNMVDRRPARRDFSNFQAIPGRTTARMRFAVELAGSGTAATAPRWSRLLRGCAMSQATQSATSRAIATAPTGASRASNITTFTTSVAHGFSPGQSVNVTGVTDGTFNGTFLVLTAPTTTTFTVANPGTNGTSGSGNAALIAGEIFRPLTDTQETLTLYLFYEGQLHRMTGACGTFSLAAEGGNPGRVEFTFSGNYLDPTNPGMATGETFPDAVAPLLEFANLTYANQAATFVANAFRLDLANNVVPRLDMSSSRGIRSFRVAGRNPTMGFDPETEATYNFFQRYVGSNPTTNPITAPFQTAFGRNASGNVAGQTIQIDAPALQITGIGYQDRDNFRTYDLAFALRRGSQPGNDEISFLFI